MTRLTDKEREALAWADQYTVIDSQAKSSLKVLASCVTRLDSDRSAAEGLPCGPAGGGKGMKRDRQAIHAKFGGRCAYCGEEITLKQMQVDHVVPIRRGVSDRYLEAVPGFTKKIERGTEEMENLFPACGPCNRLKLVYSVEEFRAIVDWNSESLRKYNCQYRHLLRFGRIVEVSTPVAFHFENFSKEL